MCQALRTLITKGCEAEADRMEVSRFAKNFLPILFNLYGQPVAAEDTQPLAGLCWKLSKLT